MARPPGQEKRRPAQPARSRSGDRILQGTGALSRDVSGRLSWGAGAVAWWVGAQDAAKRPAAPGAAPAMQTDPASRANSLECRLRSWAWAPTPASPLCRCDFRGVTTSAPPFIPLETDRIVVTPLYSYRDGEIHRSTERPSVGIQQALNNCRALLYCSREVPRPAYVTCGAHTPPKGASYVGA